MPQQTRPQQIKTVLKFKRGTEGVNTGKVYGFVTKDNGHWKGCRDTDDCKKKIVLVDPSAAVGIVENSPYSASLIPMHSDRGFIAMSVSPMKFKAKIITKVKKNTFTVTVKFGVKSLIYDPSSKIEKQTNIKAIADTIRHRNDLQCAIEVADDFVDAACMVRNLYNRSVCSSTK